MEKTVFHNQDHVAGVGRKSSANKYIQKISAGADHDAGVGRKSSANKCKRFLQMQTMMQV